MGSDKIITICEIKLHQKHIFKTITQWFPNRTALLLKIITLSVYLNKDHYVCFMWYSYINYL